MSLVIDATVGVTERIKKLANMAVEWVCAGRTFEQVGPYRHRGKTSRGGRFGGQARLSRRGFRLFVCLDGRAIDKVLGAALAAAGARASRSAPKLNDLHSIREGGQRIRQRAPP